MANTKPLSVPVLPGVRENISAHVAPLGTLRTAKNVRFPFQGEAQCRRGTRALAVATSCALTYASIVGPAGPDFLAPVSGGFVFGAKGLGYRYDFATDRVHASGSYANALPKGRLTTIAREELSVSTNVSTPYPLSQATTIGAGGSYVAVLHSINEGGGVNPEANGWICQVFTDGGTLVATFDQFAIGNATAGWVLSDASAAGTFIVLKRDGTSIQAAVITTSATGATLGAFSTVATLTGATGYWAACNWPGIGWALTYQSGATTVTIKKMAALTTVASTTLTNTGSQPISIYCDASNLYHGYVDVNFLGDCVSRATVYNTSLVVTSGGTVACYTDTAIPSLSLSPPLFGPSATAGQAFVLIARSLGAGGSVSADLTRPMTLTATGTITTPGADGDIHGVLPLTAPFNNGMFWGRLQVNVPGTIRNILLDFVRDRLGSSRLLNPKVALVTDSFYAPTANTTWWGAYYLRALAAPVRLANNDWVVGLPRVVRNENGGSGGLALSEWLRFQTEAARKALSAAGMVIVPGDPVIAEHPFGTAQNSSSAAQEYGTDIGLYASPTIISTTPSVGAGALTASATYQYRAVIERIDNRSRRQRSAPSPVIAQATAVGQNTMTLSIGFPGNILRRYCRASSAADNAIDSRYVVHIYRTEANGALFYRCTPPQGAPIVPSGTTSFTDLISDAALLTREDLYTDGGALDNNHPSSCRFIKATEDRFWLGGLWDVEQLQSSKINVPTELPQFSDLGAFRAPLMEEATGIAFQDGAVIVFSASAIYAVAGAGPSDLGQGAWDTPRCITRSTGCISDLSILETSAGVFFQSARGIELLPRGFGEPVFVGQSIQESFGVNAVTSCAVITSDESRTARFCNGSSRVFTFDLDSGAWTIDQYPVQVAAICDTDHGAVLALETPTTDGYGFLVEDAAITTDAAGAAVEAEITSELEWADIRPFTGGICGWGRFNNAVALLDEVPDVGYTDNDVSLFVSIDSFVDVGASFPMSGLSAPDYRAHIPAAANGTSVRLKATFGGAGWRFMGWTLDIDDSHGGSRRVAQSERG